MIDGGKATFGDLELLHVADDPAEVVRVIQAAHRSGAFGTS
jgi:hypothetical protein